MRYHKIDVEITVPRSKVKDLQEWLKSKPDYVDIDIFAGLKNK